MKKGSGKFRVRVRLHNGEIRFIYKMIYRDLEHAWRRLKCMQDKYPDWEMVFSRAWDDACGSSELPVSDIDLSSKDDFLALNAQ